MKIPRVLAAVTAVLLSAAPAMGQTVVDGETIDYAGVVVHLWGISAPPKGAVCADGWPAGAAAMDHLQQLMQGRAVLCALSGPDKGARVTARCTAGGRDLGGAQAKAGMAWARTQESDDYTVQETEAMAAVRGVHAHPCDELRKR